MLNHLRATGPHADLVDPVLFGQFVGGWEMDVRFFDDDGQCFYHRPGFWAFDWVLDGRAIQDVLTYPLLTDPTVSWVGARGIGTSLRYYQPATKDWLVIWHGVVTAVTVVLHGGRAGDDIVLDSDPEPDGAVARWRFSDIQPRTFHWTGHETHDGGDTWHLRQEMHGHRR